MTSVERGLSCSSVSLFCCYQTCYQPLWFCGISLFYQQSQTQTHCTAGSVFVPQRVRLESLSRVTFWPQNVYLHVVPLTSERLCNNRFLWLCVCVCVCVLCLCWCPCRRCHHSAVFARLSAEDQVTLFVLSLHVNLQLFTHVFAVSDNVQMISAVVLCLTFTVRFQFAQKRLLHIFTCTELNLHIWYIRRVWVQK